MAVGDFVYILLAPARRHSNREYHSVWSSNHGAMRELRRVLKLWEYGVGYPDGIGYPDSAVLERVAERGWELRAEQVGI